MAPGASNNLAIGLFLSGLRAEAEIKRGMNQPPSLDLASQPAYP